MLEKIIRQTVRAIKVRIAFIGMPTEPMNEAGPDWSAEVKQLDHVLDLLNKCQSQTSTWTQDMQDDLYAWLADNETHDFPQFIEGAFPDFVLGWTVQELVAAIQNR